MGHREWDMGSGAWRHWEWDIETQTVGHGDRRGWAWGHREWYMGT